MSTNQAPARGFFASLFDFGFTSFITLSFLRVIYGVLVIVTLVAAVAIFLLTISRGGIYGVLAMLIVPLVTLFQLIMVRISLEAIALFFRIGENTSVMAAAAGGVDLTGAGGYFGPSGPNSGESFSPSGPGPFGGPAL